MYEEPCLKKALKKTKLKLPYDMPQKKEGPLPSGPLRGVPAVRGSPTVGWKTGKLPVMCGSLGRQCLTEQTAIRVLLESMEGRPKPPKTGATIMLRTSPA